MERAGGRRTYWSLCGATHAHRIHDLIERQKLVREVKRELDGRACEYVQEEKDNLMREGRVRQRWKKTDGKEK